MNYRIKAAVIDGENVWHLQAQRSKGERWDWLSVCGFPAYFKEKRRAQHVCLMLRFPKDFKKDESRTITTCADELRREARINIV